MKWIFLFLLISVNTFAADSTYTKKWCAAYNTFSNKDRIDNNVYLYSNIYNTKHDWFVYLNLFQREKEITSKSVSVGLFYDRTLTTKIFIWSFYQGEKEIKTSYNCHQLAAGLGVYLINRKALYLTMNNGVIQKYSERVPESRYLFRLKSRLTIKRFYFETFNYFQPKFENYKDLSFITFNTITYRLHKNFNLKVYQWHSSNNILKSSFSYIIFGFSIENW
jgi:hypothetical protein